MYGKIGLKYSELKKEQNVISVQNVQVGNIVVEILFILGILKKEDQTFVLRIFMRK